MSHDTTPIRSFSQSPGDNLNQPTSSSSETEPRAAFILPPHGGRKAFELRGTITNSA